MRLGLLARSGGLVSWKPGSAQDVAALAAQGFRSPVVAAEIRNKGRMAVSVEKVEAVYSNGITLTGLAPPAGPQLPYRLDAHAGFTYILEGDAVFRGAKATVAIGGTDQVLLRITLGNGKTIETKPGRIA